MKLKTKMKMSLNTLIPKWRTCKVTTLILIVVVYLCDLSDAIMTFPEHGVYSLFPHEDLRTGKKLSKFDDDRDSYRDREKYTDRGRDDISYHHRPEVERPSPFIVDILRPTSNGPSTLRKLTNSFESFHRDRERDRERFPNGFHNDDYDRYKNNRSPRVYFDDERRVFGYGKQYKFHDELPPHSNEDRLRDNSRETNLIRPSPVDFTDRPNYRYLPEAKLPPRARDKDDDDGNPPARIHLFTPHNADKFGSSRTTNHGHAHPDGPVLVNPGPNAFLNHEEYLNFHTKIALDTLELEKRKLEDTRRKILFSPSPRPQSNGGTSSIIADELIPPNFSKEVTVIEESVEGSSDERKPDFNGSSTESTEEEDENNIGTTTTSTSIGNNGTRGSQLDNNNKKLDSSTTKSSSAHLEHDLTPSTFITKIVSTTNDDHRHSHSSSASGQGENDKTKFKGEIRLPSTPSLESGFLPVVPFQLRGQEHSKPQIVSLNSNLSHNSSKVNASNYPQTTTMGNIYNKKSLTEGASETKFNLPSPSSVSTVSQVNFNINSKPTGTGSSEAQGGGLKFDSSSSFSKDKQSEGNGHGITSSRRPSGTNPTTSLVTNHDSKTTTKDRVPSFPVTPTTTTWSTISATRPQSSSLSSSWNSGEMGGKRKIASIASIPPTHSKAHTQTNRQAKPSPFVFVDSSEVPSSFNLSMPHQPPPHDKMMIYVQRVKNSVSSPSPSSSSSTTSRKRHQQQAVGDSKGIFSTTTTGEENRVKIESTVSVHESQGSYSFDDEDTSKPSLEFYPVKYNESGLTTDEPYDQVIATTGNGINSGVVAHVKAHISSCPKLYGSVEVICDVHVRDRHGHPNPQLIVGWLRKFYNETQSDKILAINKTLAYEEDFHDKFNVTLAPGIAPMLRSVLIIRQVTAPDCGNYQCEVFDGVSTHKSETLLFLCH